QAAFGIAIERRFGADVRLLARRGSRDAYGRRYLLDRFPFVDARVVGPEAAAGAPGYGETGASEETLAALFRQQPRVALQGYWQHERFFFGQEQAIAAAFQLTPAPDLAGKAAALRARAAIGVHLRRSDYGHHGLATADYYHDAIAAIRGEAGPAPVLCFTDEPNVARSLFRAVPDLVVVRPNTEDPRDEFYLLSQCRHFVIANSSFSWWAAWLGAQPDSIVYAPLPWCVFSPALDPAPPRWRRVENAVRGL
ncbi:MAG TPA: alpha-1,2-fucosyltransferase, partial [Caulobacteraceae bacterium]|nr:alpha-1,2-fucosyltransferase [Caulobacteraceae bacterium]